MISSKIKRQGSIKSSALMNHRHMRVHAIRCWPGDHNLSCGWQQLLLVVRPLMKLSESVMRDAEA
jgi:hypothetical protein